MFTKYFILGEIPNSWNHHPPPTTHHLYVTNSCFSFLQLIFLNKRECYPKKERINLAALLFQKVIQMPKDETFKNTTGVSAVSSHPNRHTEKTDTWKDKMLLQIPMHTQQLGNPPKGGSFISSTAITLSYLGLSDKRWLVIPPSVGFLLIGIKKNL